MWESFLRVRIENSDFQTEIALIEANITSMPESIWRFQDLFRRQQIMILWTTVGSVITSYYTGWLVYAFITAYFAYKIWKWFWEKKYQEFTERFSQELKAFEKDSKKYAVPFIQALVVDILQEAKKQWSSDEDIVQIIWELANYFSNRPEWKAHFQFACQTHPYIEAWMKK